MKKIHSLFMKELRYYLNSAVIYVIGVVFLILSAVIFNYPQFAARDQANLRAYFGVFPLLFTVFIPALTMRIWSEEQRQGTQELLFTLPFAEWQLVLGKFLAPLVIVTALLVLTLPVPVSVSILGNVDLGVLLGEYWGMFVLGAAEISLGMFISSLTKNQIVSFLVSVSLLLGLTLIEYIPREINLPDALSWFLQYISLGYHSQGFIKGVFDSRDLLYYGIFVAFFLFLNERSLVLRKWS